MSSTSMQELVTKESTVNFLKELAMPGIKSYQSTFNEFLKLAS